jgi:hypothetical protein
MSYSGNTPEANFLQAQYITYYNKYHQTNGPDASLNATCALSSRTA